MRGYGYSIWLVPKINFNMRKFLEREKLGHILHITVKTNIKSKKEGLKLLEEFKNITNDRKIKVSIKPVGINMTSMYEHDPIEKSWGFEVDVFSESLNKLIYHRPHMTVCYFQELSEKDGIIVTENIDCWCDLKLASTISTKPEKWKIINS